MQNGKTKVKAVVFDYGNVLSLPQPPSFLADMARVCRVPMEQFPERYWRYRLDYDRADLNAETFWGAAVREEGRSLSKQEIDELVALDSEGWGIPNPVMLDWARQLRTSGLRTAVLSNMPPEIGRYLLKHREWLSAFDPLIFSCDVRSVKPDAMIYRYCLDRLQLAPEEVLFLDDKAPNVLGARELGIHGLLFDTVENAFSHIGERFDLPLPDLSNRGVVSASTSSQ